MTESDSSPAAPAATVDQRPWSLWAIASAAIAPIPLLSIIATILGVVGLAQTRYKGYRGQRLAFVGIGIGFMVTTGCLGIILMVGARTRTLVLEGPRAPINAALAGDPAVLRGELWGAAADAAEADPAAFDAFVVELRQRYGSITASRQSETQPEPDPDNAVHGQAKIRYEVRFERGGFANMDAILVIHEPGKPIPYVTKWAQIVIRDMRLGTLAFPPSALAELQPEADAVDAPESSDLSPSD